METRDLIFVVDDNELFLSLITQYLAKRGNYEIKSFSNGIKMMGELYLKPKAILLDYYLDANDKSALNGNEIVEVIKVLKGKFPVIVFSGACKEEKVDELKALGISNYIPKGVHNFYEKIESALRMVINRSME